MQSAESPSGGDPGARAPSGRSFAVAAEELRKAAFVELLSSANVGLVGERASLGHSPSARAIVNAGDDFEMLCLAVPPPPQPGPTLRDKVLARMASVLQPRTPKPGGEQESAPRAILPSIEAVACRHIEASEDARRRETVAALGARGGVGHEAADAKLRHLLEQLAAFSLHEVILVSALDGDETVHRVHRGFPKEMGYVDVIRRIHSFCTHCVSGDEPLVVENAAGEAFFRTCAAVEHMSVRSYLGVPIRAAVDGGHIGLGSLCGLSARTIRMVDADVQLMSLFAERAEAIVARRTDILESKDGLQARDGSPLGVYPSAWFRRLCEAALGRSKTSFLAVGRREHASVVDSSDVASVEDDELCVLIGSAARAAELAAAGLEVVERSATIASFDAWRAACR